MKKISFCICMMSVALVLAACGNRSNQSAQENEPVAETEVVEEGIPYTVANNYFVNNTVTGDVPAKITTQEDFDRYFGAAATMGEGGQPTAIDFSKQFVIVVAGELTEYPTTLTAKSLQQKNGQLVFTYTKEVAAESAGYSMRPLLMIVVSRDYDGEVVVEED